MPGLVLALLAGMLASCSGAPSADAGRARTVAVTKDVTVTWPAGSAASGLPLLTARSEPDATAAPAKPLLIGGRTLPSAVTVLAPAQHLIASSGRFPRGGAVLSFRVSRNSVPSGTTPFLATLDIASGQWLPVRSSYDATAGVVSAHIAHFSIWAPFDWVKSAIAAVLKGALASLFGLGGSGAPPDCSGSAITVTDSRPGSGVGACAQSDGTGRALVKIVDQRPYPVDLLYQPGAQVSVPSADLFTQLGEDLSNLSSTWRDRVLLPGGAEADATVVLPAGQRAEFGTEMDSEACLGSILGTGIQLLAQMLGGWEKKLAQQELDALSKATCLRDAVQAAQTATLSLETAQSLGSVAFECLAAVAKGIGAAAFTVASIAASLVTELVAGVWGVLDTILGNSDHLIAVSQTSSPGLIVYFPCCGIPGSDQHPQSNLSEDYRSRTATFDATGSHVLENATWQVWNATEAVAAGTAAINSCEPACAGGHYNYVPATITLSAPRRCDGYWFWSTAIWHFPDNVPAGETQNQSMNILPGC